MIKILVFADIVEKGRFEIWLENQTDMLKKDFSISHCLGKLDIVLYHPEPRFSTEVPIIPVRTNE